MKLFQYLGQLPDGLTEIKINIKWRLAILAERQTCSNKMNERAAFERFEKNARLLENAFALRLFRFSHGKSQRCLTIHLLEQRAE